MRLHLFGAFVRNRSLLRNAHIMNTKSWSGAETEHLIELYRNERCFWDSSDADYPDADLRQAAQQRISTEFGLDVTSG